MLYAHALRSYFFAWLLGNADGLRFDEELLYVGCVLHDIGLTPAHDEPVRSFEFVSADVAAELAERREWALARRHTLHRSIVLHMAPGISPAELPEVLLLEAGVACDVSGARVSDISRRAMQEIVARYSRKDFRRGFAALLGREARRKPDCSAALLFGLGSGGASGRPICRTTDAVRCRLPDRLIFGTISARTGVSESVRRCATASVPSLFRPSPPFGRSWTVGAGQARRDPYPLCTPRIAPCLGRRG